MRQMPPAARAFLYIVYALAVVALVLTYAVPHPTRLNGAIGDLLAFVALAALGGHVKVNLIPNSRNLAENEAGSMSLGFAMIFAALLRFGPEGAVVAGMASTVASCLRPRQPWYQFLFNVSVNIIETATAGWVLLQLNHGGLEFRSFDSFFAVVASCLTFFFLNTGAVASIIALSTGNNPLRIWRESFLWTAPSYFIGAGVSTLAVFVVGNKLAATLLCAAPVAYLTHASYKSYLKHAEGLLQSKEELANLYLSTIRSLALAIDAKDQYTHQHILRVQQYAVATAVALGIEGNDLKAIETGALLHDIGKLGVPEYVLLKPGRLTEEEYAQIKQHPTIGADILDPVKFPWPVLPLVKYHHERWDGSGYPDGLVGEDIPLAARVLSVADVYDALTSSRSYRTAWTHERAIEEIRSKSGRHFDPQVVEAFLTVIDRAREKTAEMGVGNLQVVRTPTRTTVPITPVTTPRSASAVRHIQRTSSELWALYEVSQTLAASLGLEDTLEILGRKIVSLFPGTGCVFLLRGDLNGGKVQELDTLYAHFATGLNQEFFAASYTLTRDSWSLQVAENGVSYCGAFDHEDLLPATSTANWTDIETALIVPIIHQGQSLGVINLYHSEADAFTSYDLHLLEMIAHRAAMALYNGLMFDRTRSDAMTDPLTGLANLRYLTSWIEGYIGRAAAEQEAEHIGEGATSASRFALLCLDLDSFKPINDNFGHQKGDLVLKELARLFLTLVREGDVVGRYGGDEFVIMLDGADPAEAAALAQRIQAAVEQYDPKLFHPRLGDLRLGVSVGCACFPNDGGDIAALLSAADVAMYRDKTERKLGKLVGGRIVMENRMVGSDIGSAVTPRADKIAVASGSNEARG